MNPSMASNSILNTLPPQTPILNGMMMQPPMSTATSLRMDMQPSMSTATTLQMGIPPTIPLHSYPNQPLPATPTPSAHQVYPADPDAVAFNQPNRPGGQMPSRPGSRIQLQASPGSTRKQYDFEPPPAANPAPLQPMGLPKTQGQLVPGRMSTGKMPSRPNSQNSHRKDPVPSTAV